MSSLLRHSQETKTCLSAQIHTLLSGCHVMYCLWSKTEITVKFGSQSLRSIFQLNVCFTVCFLCWHLLLKSSLNLLRVIILSFSLPSLSCASALVSFFDLSLCPSPIVSYTTFATSDNFIHFHRFMSHNIKTDFF